MKDKTTAALLALFLGYLGVHRFYLRQNGLGIFYIFSNIFLGLGFFLGIIDFFRFLFMEEEEFDFKYNRKFRERQEGLGTRRRVYDTDFDRNKKYRRTFKETIIKREEYFEEKGEEYFEEEIVNPPRPEKKVKSNPFTSSGIEKYRNFDYYGAINDFVKALESDGESVPLHFNLACAYSLTEQGDQAFFHLNKAVEHGFKDFEKIRSHDALAYIRVSSDFEAFAKNGYRILKPHEKKKEGLVTANPDLLEQLRQLGELRERELLTEEEFIAEKKKLLR